MNVCERAEKRFAGTRRNWDARPKPKLMQPGVSSTRNCMRLAKKLARRWIPRTAAIPHPMIAVAESGENAVDHLAVHVRQADIPAPKAISQLFVIQTQQTQNGGVKVIDLRHVLD